MSIVKINERSWGIDLISSINEYIAEKDLVIKRAGGENSLKSTKNAMFPDVLLFGDNHSAKILLGWELKMPDTDINDEEFINNAYTKAQLLKLNSFLLWNVNYAKLYVIEDKRLKIEKEWHLSRILKTREEVQNNKSLWTELLKTIILDINEFILNDTISTTNISYSLTSEDIISFIFNNKYLLVDKYSSIIVENAQFQDKIDLWWKTVVNEYPKNSDKLEILAEINILSWINKFIFANLLKCYFNQARIIEDITEITTTSEALQIIETISRNCDFYNIFKTQMANEIMPDIIWKDLKNLNSFLVDSHIQDIDSSEWHKIFEELISVKHRKLYGQYSTPPNLARLLVNLTVENKNLSVLDPCCGTGTIAKEVFNLKKQYLVSNDFVRDKIWASDKIAFPLQLATISLFNPNESSEVINVFQEDVANLSIGKDILFFNPNNGDEVHKKLPKFDYIVSNLPFVKGQDIPDYNERIRTINDFIINNLGNEYKLGLRADLAYYIPFKLWSILNNNGKLGIIISNSWLGTEAGATFRNSLRKFFYIENVVTSGNGRWFDNAKVISNILILKKKSLEKIQSGTCTERVCFTTLKQKFNELDINENLSFIRNNQQRDNEIVRKAVYTSDEIQNLENMGIQWSALFTDLNWLVAISDKLIAVKELFTITRGERRGWDPLFYPSVPNNIESRFLKPFLKTIRSVDNLIAKPDGVAFCCGEDFDVIKNNYAGAYSWIMQFKNARNGVGKLLPEVLTSSNMHWYEMSPIYTANLVTSINPDERLFVAKFDNPTFVNQRLISFTKKNDNIDIELTHALLNSLLGVFYIEMLGFGRGEGVLDLSASKLQNSLKILNYNLLNSTQKKDIIKAFRPLLNRKVKPIMQELNSQDRIIFDKAVLKAFNIEEHEVNIKKALLDLYNIRKSI